MSDIPPVSAALTDLGIPHRVFRHSGPLHSLEQAAHERDQAPEQVVRSILFRLSEGSYCMVLVGGPRQISWPALRRYLEQSRLTLASEEEVLQITGYPLGAVAPFGLHAPVRILVDQSVLDQDEISLGSGVRYVAVFLRSSDLLKALPEAEVGNFTSPE